MTPNPASSRESILELALALEPLDRAYVAEELERSLPQSSWDTPEMATAWSEEIDRRIAALNRGEVSTIDFDATLRRAKQALAERRSQRAEP